MHSITAYGERVGSLGIEKEETDTDLFWYFNVRRRYNIHLQ